MIFIPNSAGMGTELPFDLVITGWLGIALLCFAWRHRHIGRATRRYPLVTAGALLLLLPWLLQARADPGVWVLLAALFLWWGSQQWALASQDKRFILQAILLLALGQALIALIQAFGPHLAARLFQYDWIRNHGRPYGIFQQINILASFLATGIGCCYLLLLKEPCRGWRAAWLAALGILSFTLVLSQSRGGQLGGAAIVLCLTGLLWKTSGRHVFPALACIAICSVAAWYITQHVTVLVNGEPYLLARSYEDSTRERWNILLITWQMIMQKPWAGWGYGTFEYEFSRYVLAHPELPYTYSSIVMHPHSELFSAWYQGGIIAFCGMLTLFAGWITLLIRAAKHSRLTLCYAVLIIPLLVHLNLEFPFYQSFVHFVLFLMLLRLGMVDNMRPMLFAQPATPWRRAIYAVSGVGLLAFSVAGLYANQQMTALEHQDFANYPTPAPWYFATQFERAKFDGMVALLMNYNVTHNEADLDLFMQQAARWSQRHNSNDVWRSMIMIKQYRGENAEVAKMRAMYQKLFPLHPLPE